MPRERVKHGEIFPVDEKGNSEVVLNEHGLPWHAGDDVPEGHTIREQPSLDVSWNRDGEWVQVGFSAPNDWWARLNDIPEPVPGHRAVFTDVLSRQEINHMIRTLRRARDAAYGADE